MTRDDILRRVADGELTPEAALALLDGALPMPQGPLAPPPAPGADAAPLPPQPPTPPAQPAPVASDTVSEPASNLGVSLRVRDSATRAIRIHASYRSLDVIADPSVRQFAVSGQHSIRREDDVVVIESRETPFSSGQQPSFSFTDLPRGLAWARQWKDARLVVRVNPELDVEIDASGANVTLSHLSAPTRLRVVAGAAKVDRHRGPLQLDCFTASVKGTLIATGRCHVTAESSSVRLHLDAGSDVAISATNRLGKVTLPDGSSSAALDGERLQFRLGQGRGEFVVDAVMSSVALSADGITQRPAPERGHPHHPSTPTSSTPRDEEPGA